MRTASGGLAVGHGGPITNSFADGAVRWANWKVPQTRIGTRLIDMPGQRKRRKVTMKLMAPTVVEMPSRIMPAALDRNMDK